MVKWRPKLRAHQFPRVYMAGQGTPIVAQHLIAVYLEHPYINFTASWPFMIAGGVENDPQHATRFWLRDMEEIAQSHYLVIWPSDKYHGALVEAGMALALKIPVCLLNPDKLGSWRYHPGCVHFDDLAPCFDWIIRHFAERRTTQPRQTVLDV